MLNKTMVETPVLNDHRLISKLICLVDNNDEAKEEICELVGSMSEPVVVAILNAIGDTKARLNVNIILQEVRYNCKYRNSKTDDDDEMISEILEIIWICIENDHDYEGNQLEKHEIKDELMEIMLASHTDNDVKRYIHVDGAEYTLKRCISDMGPELIQKIYNHVCLYRSRPFYKTLSDVCCHADLDVEDRQHIFRLLDLFTDKY